MNVSKVKAYLIRTSTINTDIHFLLPGHRESLGVRDETLAHCQAHSGSLARRPVERSVQIAIRKSFKRVYV